MHPVHQFPYVSLLALAGVAALFCFLRLADLIAALVVIRIILQFLVQSIGVIVLTDTTSGHAASFSDVAISRPGVNSGRELYFYSGSRRNFLREVRYAGVILVVGLAIYLVRAWRHGEWPFPAGL